MSLQKLDETQIESEVVNEPTEKMPAASTKKTTNAKNGNETLFDFGDFRSVAQICSRGRLVILPIVSGPISASHRSLRYELWIYKKGVVGPEVASSKSVEEIGGSPGLYASALKLQASLRAKHPTVFNTDIEYLSKLS